MNARRVQNVRACLCICLKPEDGFLERLRMSDEVALRPRRKQYFTARSVDGGARRFDTRNCQRQLVKRVLAISGVVFDRKTSHARVDTKPNVGRDAFWLIGVSGFEIRIYG